MTRHDVDGETRARVCSTMASERRRQVTSAMCALVLVVGGGQRRRRRARASIVSCLLMSARTHTIDSSRASPRLAAVAAGCHGHDTPTIVVVATTLATRLPLSQRRSSLSSRARSIVSDNHCNDDAFCTHQCANSSRRARGPKSRQNIARSMWRRCRRSRRSRLRRRRPPTIVHHRHRRQRRRAKITGRRLAWRVV